MYPSPNMRNQEIQKCDESVSEMAWRILTLLLLIPLSEDNRSRIIPLVQVQLVIGNAAQA